MKHSVFEAQRLLKLANEKDNDATALVVKALHELAQANPSMPLKWALYHVDDALPGAALTEKEKELLSA